MARRMTTAARIGNGKVATTESVRTKETAGELVVPFREIETVESIALGFRVGMFDLKDADGNGISVSTGAGFGTDAIILDWKDGKEERQMYVAGADLATVWVSTFNPDAAENMRRAVAEFYGR